MGDEIVNSIVVKLKRIIVQIVLIAISLAGGIFLLWNPLKIADFLQIQLLSICSGIFTGALLSLLYITIEKKFEDKQAREAEKRAEERSEKVSSEIKSIHSDIKNLDLPGNCAYCKHYIKSVESRDQIDIGGLLDNAKKRIWFLTTNLSYFISYAGKIEDAVKRGVEVRLLVLHPNSPFVDLRHKEIGFRSAKEFFAEMAVSLKGFYNLQKKLEASKENINFKIKTHSHFPSCLIYIFDKTLIFNTILAIGKARTTSHIIYDLSHNRAKELADNYERTYEECWKDGQEVLPNYRYDKKQYVIWRGH